MDSLRSLLEQEQADEDFDLLETITNGADAQGWKVKLQEAMELLSDVSQMDLWYRAIAVCFWAVPRVSELPEPKMAIVARLYWCLIQHPDLGDDAENLVWSISKDLKGVSYESEWDPMKDPEVTSFRSAMG